MGPSDKTNKESVRAIQKSIFTVCLDAPMPRVSDEMYQSRVAAQMLHGGGARWNSGNRWFDKTLQVSVGTSADNVDRFQKLQIYVCMMMSDFCHHLLHFY